MLALLVANTACSFKNKNTVNIFVDSTPSGSELIIDGKKYGTTPATLSIIPSGKYKILIQNSNHKDYEFDIVSKLGPRSDPAENIRCLVDASTSFLIVPMVSLYSSKCRDFDQKSYHIILQKLQTKDGGIDAHHEIFNSKTAQKIELPKSSSSPTTVSQKLDDLIDRIVDQTKIVNEKISKTSDKKMTSVKEVKSLEDVEILDLNRRPTKKSDQEKIESKKMVTKYKILSN